MSANLFHFARLCTTSANLSLLETQEAIKDCKDAFIDALAKELSLSRVSAPLFVLSDSGLNDNLNGVEHPVSFTIPALGAQVEIVQSLAKWTVSMSISSVRSSRVIIFSQSHWST